MADNRQHRRETDLRMELDRIVRAREEIADIILAIITVVGLPAILMSIPRGLDFGFRTVQFVVYAAYFLNVAITLARRRIGFRVKAFFLAVITFTIGVTSFLDWGLFGLNSAFILASIVISTILFGYRSGLFWALLSVAAMAAIALFLHIGWHEFQVDFNSFARAPSSWLNAIANLSFFTAVLLIAFGRLHKVLTESIDMLGKRTEDLEASRRDLQSEVMERVKAQEIISESEERYRLLAENATDVIWTMGPDFKVTYVSPSIENIMGYTPEETRELGLKLISSESARMLAAVFKEELEKITASGAKPGPRTIELSARRKDGTWIWTETTGRLMVDHEGNPTSMLGVTRDVSERKKLEDQLLQSQKMEAIGRLAGGIAHDFNNQLMVILNFSDMILADLPPDHPHSRKLDLINKAGEKSASLVSQLLAFSRKQVIEPRTVDINKTIKDLDKMLASLIGEDIELNIATLADPPFVKIDPVQVEQVVINLAVNARDAMPGGGKLTIETDGAKIGGAEAWSELDVPAGDYVMLAVSDTGQGMDRETKERLFEPFFTTKERDAGTGLGLATVYGIVKQAGGHIHVYSEPGQGTTFKIYLPLVEKEDEDPAREGASQGVLGGTESILVVEDDDSVRFTVVGILSDAGYKVTEARSGEEAIEMLTASPDSHDLVITDVIMTGMNGKEMVDAIKEINPGQKAVFVSGYTDNVIVNHGVLEEGVDFVQKPFTSNRFLTKVREVLDSDKSS